MSGQQRQLLGVLLMLVALAVAVFTAPLWTNPAPNARTAPIQRPCRRRLST